MINRPRNTNSNGLSLIWANGFTRTWNRLFGRSQEIIDTETLRYSEQFTPRKEGILIRSGQTNTVIGSGIIKYKTPYARRLYYNRDYRFRGRPQRGAYWFERMKRKYKKTILRTARRGFNS